jgi:hypothetical protein
MLAAVLALAVGLLACGGDDDDGGGGSSDEDPQQVLDRTFSPDSEIESANLDASFEIDVEGQGGGNLTATLSGPIDAKGSGTPKFDLTVTAQGEGGGDSIDFEGGVTSTGDSGFVSYQGQAYQLDAQTFGVVQDIFASASQQQGEQQQSGLPQVKTFLTDLTNEGTADVEGTETVHISGAVDIEKLVDTLRPLAEQADELGGLGATAQLPSPEELDQLTELVESADFDVYSGTEDNLLRKLDLNFDLQDPSGSGTATIALDVTLSEVNEDLSVEAPSDARPLRQLLDDLGVDLGALGGLGGLGGGGQGGGGGGATQPDEQIECLQQAQTPAELEQCLQ